MVCQRRQSSLLYQTLSYPKILPTLVWLLRDVSETNHSPPSNTRYRVRGRYRYHFWRYALWSRSVSVHSKRKRLLTTTGAIENGSMLQVASPKHHEGSEWHIGKQERYHYVSIVSREKRVLLLHPEITLADA